jgi:nickel-dependent lactate racemase
MGTTTIRFAQEEVTLPVDDGILRGPPSGQYEPPLADLPAAVAAALAQPLDFPPLKQALTPDDRVAIVVNEGLTHVSGLLGAVLRELEQAGVMRSNVTVVVPPRAFAPVHDCRGPHADLRLEVHNPDDPRRLAYLASTRGGRRIYLNRTVVDADQLIVLGRVRFDPLFGYSGGFSELFPLLSDQATRREFLRRPSLYQAGHARGRAQEEAAEVGNLLGVPFFIQAVETHGDQISHVVAGSAAAVSKQAQKWLNRHARFAAASADLVVAPLSIDSDCHNLADVAAALETASRVVRPGGRIVVLSRARSELSPGFELLRGAESPEHGLGQAQRQGLADAVSLWQWTCGLQHANVTLLSQLSPEVAEDLFVTPMDHPGQLERLTRQASSMLLIPDAHRFLVDRL